MSFHPLPPSLYEEIVLACRQPTTLLLSCLERIEREKDCTWQSMVVQPLHTTVEQLVQAIPSVVGDRIFALLCIVRAMIEIYAMNQDCDNPPRFHKLLWKTLFHVAAVSRLEEKSSVNKGKLVTTNRSLVIDSVATHITERIYADDTNPIRYRHRHQLYLEDPRYAMINPTTTSSSSSSSSSSTRHTPTNTKDGRFPWFVKELEQHSWMSQHIVHPTNLIVLDYALKRLFQWLSEWSVVPSTSLLVASMVKGLTRKAQKWIESHAGNMEDDEVVMAITAMARQVLLGTAAVSWTASHDRLRPLLKWLVNKVAYIHPPCLCTKYSSPCPVDPLSQPTPSPPPLQTISMNDNCFIFSIELLSHILVHMSPLVITDKLFVDTVCRLMSLVASADEKKRSMLLNTIGYCLVQRLGKPESLTYVQQQSPTQNASNTVFETHEFVTLFSLLFGSHGLSTTTLHPIFQLLLNVYLAPHLGCIQHLDSLKANDLNNLDPSAIFASHLNLRNHCIMAFPLTSTVLEPYLFPTDVDEQQLQQQQKRRMIPDIHALTRRSFAILVRSLLPDVVGDELSKRKKKKSKTSCSRLDGFSCDLVSEILSYLSFKRVCRMALVSTRFLKASRALALWEILYRQRFPDVLWSVGTDTALEGQRECLHCYRITQRQRPSSSMTTAGISKYCSNPTLQHQWPILFRDKAVATRKVRLAAASNRRSQKGSYKTCVCPYLGCVFVLRSESKEVMHFQSHNNEKRRKGKKEHKKNV